MPNASSGVGRTYRIDRPTLGTVLRDLRIPAGDPGPADRVPCFDIPTTDGGRFSTATVGERGRPLVLVFGSLTCPITESAGTGLAALHRKYADAVEFVVVNVREAHPGASLPQPRLSAEKMRNGRALKTHHGFRFPVAVDDIDGSVHRAFGTRPSSAYVIDASGTIVFRAHWSNRIAALEEAVRAVHSGRTPSRATAGQTVRALAGMAGPADVALRSAGRGAMRDFWLAAPPVAAYLSLSRLVTRLGTRRRRTTSSTQAEA